MIAGLKDSYAIIVRSDMYAFNFSVQAMEAAYNSLNKKIVKFIIWVVLFFAVCLSGFSQNKKNAVVLELAGKAFSYYDISYERYLCEKFHLGIGIGLEGVSKGYSQSGEHTDFDFRFPLYCAYTFGKKKHHVMTEIGVTFEEHWHTGIGIYTDLWPFISGGYEYRGSKIIIRIPIYLTYVGPNEWWPSVLPWAGLGIGVPF